MFPTARYGVIKSVTSRGGVRFGTNLDRGKLLLRSRKLNPWIKRLNEASWHVYLLGPIVE